MKIYISGPMTGYPDNNFPEFNRIADKIRAMGKAHIVINPVELDRNLTPAQSSAMKREDYMKQDLAALCTCKAIVLHGHWRRSRGSSIEAQIATWLKLDILDENLEPIDMNERSCVEDTQPINSRVCQHGNLDYDECEKCEELMAIEYEALRI